MTATVFDFATRARLAPMPAGPVYVEAPTPWWICPSWCLHTPGTCAGGGTWIDDGLPPVTDMRIHERVVVAITGVDDHRPDPVTVELRMERGDSPGEPGPTDVVLRVEGHGIQLTRAQRIELAAALLAANDLDDTLETPRSAAEVADRVSTA